MTDTKQPPSPFSTNIPNFQIAGITVSASRVEKFWSNMVRVGECLEWQGPFTHNGYGQFNIGGRSGTNIRVHRMAYELRHGPIPTGKLILHSCDNRRCCEDLHTKVGSAADNTADMLSKGRAKGGQVERWSPVEMETAIRLRKEGKSCQQIANALDNEFSHETVRIKLKEAGAWTSGKATVSLLN